MFSPNKLYQDTLTAIKKWQVRPENFFELCLEELKGRQCPIIAQAFEAEVAKIKRLSCYCRAIERLHVENRLEKCSEESRSLLYLYLITISENPLRDFREGLRLRLDAMAEVTRDLTQNQLSV